MSGLIFHLIPHTHWDREWYLPRAAFQARLIPALDDLLERLQADPGYRSFLLDGQTDRKSTRLNSSHSQISYAVFCLKKKKDDYEARRERRPFSIPSIYSVSH